MKKLLIYISIIALTITINAFAQVSDSQRKAAWDYWWRGNSSGFASDYNSALRYYNMAILLNPELAVAYRNRGIAKLNLGDKQGACSDWQTAIKLIKLGYVYSGAPNDCDKLIRENCK